jgi:hypothetical protein
LALQIGLGLIGIGLHLAGDILANLGKLQDRGTVEYHNLGLRRIGHHRRGRQGESRESELESGSGHLSTL